MCWSRWTSPPGVFTSSELGRPSIVHSRSTQGPTATTTCSAWMSPRSVCTVVTAPEPSVSKPVTVTPASSRAPAARAFAGQSLHRRHVVGEAALLLVQADVDALRPPVREHRQHVLAHLALADDQLGRVADVLLPLVDLGQVADLALGAQRAIADRVVAERLRILFPDLDVGGHQLAHRRLVVVVADDAAGDPGRAGPDARLVDDQDVRLRSPRPTPPWPGARRSRGRARRRR